MRRGQTSLTSQEVHRSDGTGAAVAPATTPAMGKEYHGKAVSGASVPDDLSLIVLQQLLENEARTVERLQRIVEAYRDPLFSKEANILTFQQHFTLFSNVKSLQGAQEALVDRLRTLLTNYIVVMTSANQDEPGVHTSSDFGSAMKRARQRHMRHGSASARSTCSSAAHHERSHSRSRSGSSCSTERSAAGSDDTVRIHDDVDDTTCATVDDDGDNETSNSESFAGSPMRQIVRSFFLDTAMTLFVAEHMMFTINYARSIMPALLDLLYNKEAGTKMMLFVQFAREISTRISFSGTLLPEHDLLGAQQEELKSRSPVEELMILMAASLPSLRRLVQAARCIVEADCDSLSAHDREELLEGFIVPATARLAEEAFLVRECVATHSARLLVEKMIDFDAPQCDSRVLLHHGRIVKKFARGRHERLALLFSDVFCYVEELSNGRWRVRGLVPLESKIELLDVEDCYFQQLSNCFEIITATSKYVFFASSAAEKREWLCSIDAARANCSRRKADAQVGIIPPPVHAGLVCTRSSRLTRQRRDDAKWQRYRLHHEISSADLPPPPPPPPPNTSHGHGASRPQHLSPHNTSSAGSLRSARSFTAGPASTTSGVVATPGSNAIRKSIRGSYNVSSWSQQHAQQQPAMHHRVKSVDLLSAAAEDVSRGDDEADTSGEDDSDEAGGETLALPAVVSMPAFGAMVHSRQTSLVASPCAAEDVRSFFSTQPSEVRHDEVRAGGSCVAEGASGTASYKNPSSREADSQVMRADDADNPLNECDT